MIISNKTLINIISWKHSFIKQNDQTGLNQDFLCLFFSLTGIDSMTFDPQRYAMDYHVIGFQECVSEVARYLIAHEGMDIQNPLRMRLLSHLRCFAAQRELSMKSTTPSANQNWTATTPAYPLPQNNYASTTSTLAPPPPPPLLTPRSLQTPTTSTVTSSILPSSSSVSSSPATAMYSSSYAPSPNYPYVPNLAPTGSSDIFAEPHTPTSTAGAVPSNESLSAHAQMQTHQQQQQQPNQYVQHQDQNGSTYTDLSSSQRNAVVSIGYSNQYNPMSAFSHTATEHGHHDDPLSAAYNNKPYRPWGGPEMAY